jgi:hypothetical protein
MCNMRGRLTLRPQVHAVTYVPKTCCECELYWTISVEDLFGWVDILHRNTFCIVNIKVRISAHILPADRKCRMALELKSVVFQDVTPCGSCNNWLLQQPTFRGFLLNVCSNKSHKASHPRRRHSSWSSPWIPQIWHKSPTNSLWLIP